MPLKGPPVFQPVTYRAVAATAHTCSSTAIFVNEVLSFLPATQNDAVEASPVPNDAFPVEKSSVGSLIISMFYVYENCVCFVYLSFFILYLWDCV